MTETTIELSHWFLTEKLTLLFVNKSDNPDPVYAHIGDSGFDLRAWLPKNENGVAEPIELAPGERIMIHTGIYCKLPKFTEIQVRPRSGLALKYGITVVNTPGTVDELYTGEICVVLHNLGKENFHIENGDRIAQAVLAPVFNSHLVNLAKTDEIPDNDFRGQKNFNSSGVK